MEADFPARMAFRQQDEQHQGGDDDTGARQAKKLDSLLIFRTSCITCTSCWTPTPSARREAIHPDPR